MSGSEVFIVHALYYKTPAKKRISVARVLAAFGTELGAKSYIEGLRQPCKSCPPREYEIVKLSADV